MVKALIDLGVPSEKIVVGGAFYGKIFENVGNANNGLGQPANFKTTVIYRNMPLVVPADSGWIYHWDENARAPYLYNPVKKQFFTYDRVAQLRYKYAHVVGTNR